MLETLLVNKVDETQDFRFHFFRCDLTVSAWAFALHLRESNTHCTFPFSRTALLQCSPSHPDLAVRPPLRHHLYHTCPSPAHPHALRYGRSRQAPVYIASRTYGHCRTTRTGPRAASSQRLQFAERSMTEFTETLYIPTTPMYCSHLSTPHPHTPPGRTGTPSVSETPDEPLLHV
jgi:hypothetical protein